MFLVSFSLLFNSIKIITILGLSATLALFIIKTLGVIVPRDENPVQSGTFSIRHVIVMGFGILELLITLYFAWF